MSWYEYVILVTVVFLAAGLMIYFGNRYYVTRRNRSSSETADTGQRRRRRRRGQPTNQPTSGNNAREQRQHSPKPEDEDNATIFTITNSRGNMRAPRPQNTQPTVLNMNERRPGHQAPTSSSRPRTHSDAQIIGTDPPPSYDQVLQETRQ